MSKKTKKQTDSNADWWKKRRAAIKLELTKDEALRQTIVIHYGYMAIPGGFTLEAYCNDMSMPLAIIWFNFAGQELIQICNLYTFEPVRRCGLMTLLQATLRSWYPDRTLITGAGTKLGKAFMARTGWKETEGGYELKRNA